VRPDSVPGYFSLAAEVIRRELLDLARRHTGPFGNATRQEPLPDGTDASEYPLEAQPTDELRNLERWAAFHETVGRLPTEDRELIDLGYYQGLSKEEMGRLLGVDERTIRRWWDRAVERIVELLGDDIPS
jgi:RNA polymerase sigma factor (sigma-70 family)